MDINKVDIDSLLIKILKKNSSSMMDKNILPMNDSTSFTKVAFDLYRVDNDPYNGLWISKDLDGKQYLVRTEDPTYDYHDRGDWVAITDYDCANVTLAYKNAPIVSFSSEEFGFDTKSVISFKDVILDKISGDDKFFSEVMLEQPAEKLNAIFETFPELKKG